MEAERKITRNPDRSQMVKEFLSPAIWPIVKKEEVRSVRLSTNMGELGGFQTSGLSFLQRDTSHKILKARVAANWIECGFASAGDQ